MTILTTAELLRVIRSVYGVKQVDLLETYPNGMIEVRITNVMNTEYKRVIFERAASVFISCPMDMSCNCGHRTTKPLLATKYAARDN